MKSNDQMSTVQHRTCQLRRHQLENRGWENLSSNRGVKSATRGGGIDAKEAEEKRQEISDLQLQQNF